MGSPLTTILDCDHIVPKEIMQGFQMVDRGLAVNRIYGVDFWHPGEVMQYRGFVNGVLVWIEKATGRMSCQGRPMYRIAFGREPEYPPQVFLQEAVELLRKELGWSNDVR